MANATNRLLFAAAGLLGSGLMAYFNPGSSLHRDRRIRILRCRWVAITQRAA